MFLRNCVWALLLVGVAGGQPRAVDPRLRYERVWAVAPLVGAGTPADPRRPMFAPTPAEMARAAREGRPGVIEYHWEAADDPGLAVVEYVALDGRAFRALREAGRADVRVFERGRVTRAELEAGLRAYKRDFDAERFAGLAGPKQLTGGGK